MHAPSSFGHRVALAVLLACAAAAASAEPGLVAAQSEIAFTSRQMGVPVDGRFRRFDAKVAFDPKAPAAAQIALTIDLASVSLGTAEVEAEVAKREWFDTKAFPQAQFQSTAVRAPAPGRLEVAGRLTLKGMAREVVVPVALAQSGGSTTASGAFTIRRLDWRIGDGDWNDPSLVANDVQVRFKLVLSGVAPL